MSNVIFKPEIEQISIRQLSGILKKYGVNIGQKQLFEWMRNNGYLEKQAQTGWNVPTVKSEQLGLFSLKEKTRLSGGIVVFDVMPLITEYGQEYFVGEFTTQK